jgi:hypothetical protein
MSMERQMEIVRYGRFAVFDRGIPSSRREQAEDRPRYAVVEHRPDLGPILRAGPFRVLANAVEQCQQMNFRAELQEEGRHDAKA